MNYISHIKELVSGIIENETVTRDTEAYNALTALKNHLETLEEVHKYMPYKDPGPIIQSLEQSLDRATTKNQELQKQILYFNEDLEKKTKSRDQCYQYWQEYKTKVENLNKTIEDLNKENAHYRDILDQEGQANKEQFQSQIEELKEELKEKNSYIEYLKKQTSDAQCDLDEWINYKGPDFEDQINKLEEEIKVLKSLLNEEQLTQYTEQTKCLSDPYHKTLYDQERDKVGFLLRLLTQEQEEEFQEYLRTQLPDDQPQYHRSPKPNRKKRRIES